MAAKRIRSTDGRMLATHGGTGTPEFNSWQQMRARCLNPNNPSFPRYGERGIAICDRWKNDFAGVFDDFDYRKSESAKQRAALLKAKCQWCGSKADGQTEFGAFVCWACARERELAQ